MMKQISILFSFIVLFVSCATITSPSGGEKDTTPPELLSASPEIGSINFSKNSFELRFNEFISRVDFAQEILVSPEIKSLKSKYYGKRIKMSWNEELQENTTYTFQFLNQIKDFNENNILAGFLYTFSTGPIIDSLSIAGEILNSGYEEAEELKVNLVFEDDFTDSTYIDGGFNFGTFSDKKGHFSFRYLPLDRFYLYAFEDKNLNKKWDEKDERVAFFPDPIESSDSTRVVFDLFTEEAPVKFTHAKHSGFNKIELLFKDEMPELEKIQLFSGSAEMEFELLEGKEKTELLFNESLALDSLCVLVNQTDTLPFYKTKYKFPRIKVTEETVDFISGEKLVFKSDYPIQKLDSTKVRTFVNADSVIDNTLQLSEDGFSLTLDYQSTALPVRVVFQDSALVYQDSVFNIMYNKSFIQKTLEDFSIIQCVFQKHDYPLIVQLFSDKDEQLREEYLEPKTNRLAFDRILPGKYKLRYIVDKDLNRKFTTGSIKKLRQPEPIIKYKGNIQLKPNWITEIVFP